MTEAVSKSYGKTTTMEVTRLQPQKYGFLYPCSMCVFMRICVQPYKDDDIAYTRKSHTHTHTHTHTHYTWSRRQPHVEVCACVVLLFQLFISGPTPRSPVSPAPHLSSLPSPRRHSINIYSGLASWLAHTMCIDHAGTLMRHAGRYFGFAILFYASAGE